MFKKLVGIAVLVLCLALPGTVFSEDTKIGFVNMRKLFFDYKKTKDFNKALEKEDLEAKEEIEKRSSEIRKLRDEIDLLSDEAKEKKKPQLERALKGLDEYRKEKAELFVQKKDQMFQEIREDIMYAASEYAKKNDYNMVLDGSVFVYSSEKYNITDDILKELNKE